MDCVMHARAYCHMIITCQNTAGDETGGGAGGEPSTTELSLQRST